MKDLFQQHITQRIQEVLDLLEENNIDSLFIESGFPDYYFLDDQPTYFKVNPHFNFLCPAQGEGHILRIDRSNPTPQLFFYIPDDFWHETSSLNNDFWEDSFKIEISNDYKKSWKQAQKNAGKNIVISPSVELAIQHGCQAPDSTFLSRMHWLRTQKTDYEIECIRLANKKAALGHLKAKELFLNGAGEWDIFQNYLLASGQRESDLPYNSITALDKNTAVLHYQFPKRNEDGQTFLIDAGARVNGYCSDITRTYVKDEVDPKYKSILAYLNDCQQQQCEMVRPGFSYIDLHRKAFEDVAQLLVEFDLFRGSKEEAFEKNLPYYFFPHGLGHPLGIQVHDVAGKQKDPSGTPVEQPKDFPFLRTLREIRANDVFTIEPGFYFIPLLLQELKNHGTLASSFNWTLIEELTPYGGIRIEDNIVARNEGPENLTRPYLP